jgi:hypothetical protein
LFRLFRVFRVLFPHSCIGADLAIHQIATVENFKSCAGSASFQSKYGYCDDGDWRKAFDRLNVKGKAMTAFACGFAAFDRIVTEAIITFMTILGAGLTLVVVVVAAIMKGIRSRESE